LIYNERDDRDAFTAAYSKIAERFKIADMQPETSHGRPLFVAYAGWVRVSVGKFHNPHRLDRAGLIARASSVSYLPKDGIAGAELVEQLNNIFEAYCQNGTVEMQMSTVATVGEAA